MYPKVKVRSQDTDDQRSGDDQIRNYSLFLNDFQSFSIYDSSSSVKEHQDVSQPLVARMPKNYVPDIIRPTTSDQKGAEKNNEKSYDDNKSNIRASPVPRPRAVLSSPDNDVMIGSKNRTKRERSSVLKNHNQTQNRHSQAQCKVIMHNDKNGTPVNSVKTKDTDKIHLATKGLATSASSQKRNLKSGKSSSIRI